MLSLAHGAWARRDAPGPAGHIKNRWCLSACWPSAAWGLFHQACWTRPRDLALQTQTPLRPSGRGLDPTGELQI
ncbi:hypothetical protein NDU88_001261 [Pleurodeles waltl]|uniref:Uncharacterized protein n=1 Tax=Pleurodeles waltl TaxID=8319 RepID=A0AAV7V951_PLEWA|nr:hypothetical protein NDU88_001261 [Pleurodeles waltl]